MARIETWFNQDLQEAVKVRYIDGNVFSADNQGNIVGVNVFDGGDPATLGGTVAANIIRSDGVTVAASGTLSGNKCSVILPQAAYAVPGVISIIIKLTSGSDITTVCAVVANVYMSSTDSVVDPGTIIPSIETLIEEIEAAVATIPADYSELWTSLAPAFSTSVIYRAGDYVTYDGHLYRFTDYHAAGSWESNKAVQVTLGSGLTFVDDAIKAVSNTQANKSLCVANYTLTPGTINKSLQLNTTDSNFRHIEYTVSTQRVLYIAGRNYSSNYPGWMIVDANNNILDYQKGIAGSTVFAENVAIPRSASKVYVNCYSNENAYICEYTEQNTEAPEVKTSLKNIGGKIVQGKAYKVNKTTTDGDYSYIEAEISEGEYFVTGRNMGKNFPLFILLDGSNNVIYYFGDSVEFNALDYKVTAPTGTKKIIVNSSYGYRYPMVKKHIKSTSENLDTVLNIDEREKYINLVSVNPTITYGSVVHFNQTTSADDNYMHTEYSCDAGKTYYVNGRNFSRNYPMIMFVNGDGNVCYTSGGSLTNNKPYFDMKVTAPLDAVTLIVNSYKGWDIDIKVDGSETLYSTLNSQQLTGVYLGETPTKEIEYDLVNGSWVYNSSKAERNLSKFGFAYAIMLERIMKTYPLATVICCNLNECERTTSVSVGFPELNKIGETVADYNNVIEKLAKAFGAILVDHHSCGITYYNLESYMYDWSSSTGEGLHPNAAGMALIARQTVKDLSGVDWTGKKVSVYGDSISTYNGTGSTYNQYPNGDVTSVGLTWWYKALITDLHMTLLTNGSGGGRSVSTIREGHLSGRPKSGCNQDAIDALAVNGTAPDVIVIKQGINDFGNVGSTANMDLNGHYYFGGL